MGRALRIAVAWMLYPTFVVGALLATELAVVENGASPMIVAFLVATSVSLAVHLLEQGIPYRTDWRRSHGDLATDICHLVFSGGIAQGAQIFTVLGVAALGTRLAAALPVAPWPAGWPVVAQLLLAVVIYELGGYWLHRLQHERGLLWRLHAVHHSGSRLYWLSSARNHPIDLAISFAVSITPIVLLGAGDQVLVLLGTLVLVSSTLQHANLAIEVGPLDRMLNVAGVHRHHHALDVAEANANYGGVLLFWDHVFGTYRRHPTPTGDVGLPGPFPTSYLGQLASPFTVPPRSAPRP